MSHDHTVITGRPVPLPARPSWLALRDRPDVIHKLRVFVGAAVYGLPYADDEIELIAVELTTNALRHAVRRMTIPADLWPIAVEVTVAHHYARLAVTDPAPQHLPDEPGSADPLAEAGRGLSIVDRLVAARWVTRTEHDKTVHVVVPATGVTLTPAELQAIREAR